MVTPPKISFMTTIGRNVGDEFIREGIRSFLDDIVPGYLPFYVDKHDLLSVSETRLDESVKLADKFLDADVIIQAGAPLYWKNAGSACHNAEWVDELWRKRIFKVGKDKVVLNIGAGSGQAYLDQSASVSRDPSCAQFIRDVSKSCRWESVRDPLASAILDDLSIRHEQLPCPAFHAARRVEDSPTSPGNVIAVNLMPLSGHYRFAPEVSEPTSLAFHSRAVQAIRRNHPIMFVAHDRAEADYMEHFRGPGESVFLSPCYRDYLGLYASCRGAFVNRVHGGVGAAGFGRPAVIVGNDSRLRIAEYIGIPNRYIASTDVEEIIDLFERLLEGWTAESERLLNLREASAGVYVRSLRKFFDVWQS